MTGDRAGAQRGRAGVVWCGLVARARTGADRTDEVGES